MTTASTAQFGNPFHYLNRAIEYYVTGRFAALNQMQIAASLLHHAVEMSIKFSLLNLVANDNLQIRARELSRRPFGHDLDTLWTSLKGQLTSRDLARFDYTVSELNRWEEIRYGGFPRGDATATLLAVRRRPELYDPADKQDCYVLILEDIDELFTEILVAAEIDPPFFSTRLARRAGWREWLAKENQYPVLFEQDPGGP